MLYSIIDEPGESDLFYLNPTTGALSLREVWPGGDKTEFQACTSTEIVICIFHLVQHLTVLVLWAVAF